MVDIANSPPRIPAESERLVTRAEIDAAYARMAAALQSCADGGDCVLLGVMLGGLLPVAELAVRLKGDFVLDYCHVTRYRGALTGGKPVWRQPPSADLAGRTVLVVDDIFDHGTTLEFVVAACHELGAAQVVTAVLVRKQHERATVSLRPDFVGIGVPDRYVFGSGMDYRHHWRHLPDIYALPAGAESAN